MTTGSAPVPDEAKPVPDSKCTTPDGKVTTGSTPEVLPSSKPAVEVPAGTSRSKCEALREVIVPLFERGLTARRIYQDLRVEHGLRRGL